MREEKHINIGNITVSSVVAVFLYFISGSFALGLKERFDPILSQNFLIKVAYFAMFLIMLGCCAVLFLCGVLLWKYDEK